jgi:hypothetical protein
MLCHQYGGVIAFQVLAQGSADLQRYGGISCHQSMFSVVLLKDAIWFVWVIWFTWFVSSSDQTNYINQTNQINLLRCRLFEYHSGVVAAKSKGIQKSHF